MASGKDLLSGPGVDFRLASIAQPHGDGVGGAFPTDVPLCAVLDGVTSCVQIDALAPSLYTQTLDVHYILLCKADTESRGQYWCAWGADDANAKPWHSAISAGTGTGGLLRTQVLDDLGASVSATSTLGFQDGAWRFVQSADWYSAGSGQFYHKMDGAARQGPHATSYTRWADRLDSPKYFTVGGVRTGVGGPLVAPAAGRVGYFAVITGEKLVSAAWTSIYDAWNTGGGRQDTRVITAAILAALSTGTCHWAGELNGYATPHHGSAVATYVDCDIVAAGY